MRTTPDCSVCEGTGHTSNGIWDCAECDGTGISDHTVREACITIVAAGREIPKATVAASDVNRFWRRLNALHEHAP